MTTVIDRVLERDADGLRAALDAGAEPNETDDFGLSALHLAMLVGGEALWRPLLDAGANPKAKTKGMASGLGLSRYLRPGGGTFYGSGVNHRRLPAGTGLDKGATSLHAAAWAGDLAAVRELLARKVRPSKDAVGATPLHLAALRGHAELIEPLLSAKVSVDAATTVRKSLWFYDVGMTALHAGLESGSHAVVVALLAAGADPTARTRAGCGSVLFAARGGSVASLDALGLPVDEDGDYLNWPLVEAVERGHLAMVERLLVGGAAPENARGQQSPLRAATARHDGAIRAVLLERGARPLDHRNPEDAARANDVEALREMAAAGIDLSVARGGSTALMGAAAQGHLPATEILLELGADPNVVTSYSALHVAISNQAWSVLDALLTAGADCSVVDTYGNQPLASLLFSRGATTERIERMLALGADPHRQNRSGSSPLDGARQLERTEWIELLAGAPASGPPDAAVYRPKQVSEVLVRAQPTDSWKRLHAELWDELVPPSGPAPTVQGELVRCIGALTDEAYRNGNANWGPRFVAMLDTLESLLLDGTLGTAREVELRPVFRALRQHRSLDLRGDGSPHYRVSEAVVQWCLARRDLVANE